MALWKGLERKDTLWKSERERREHDISEREQQLATREAALTGKAEALDPRKQELKDKLGNVSRRWRKTIGRSLTRRSRTLDTCN